MSFQGVSVDKQLATGVEVKAGVNPDFTASAKLLLSYSHDVFPESPGVLKIVAGADGIGVEMDPLLLAAMPLEKSTNQIEQFMATQLKALRAGAAVHPAIAAAAAEVK